MSGWLFSESTKNTFFTTQTFKKKLLFPLSSSFTFSSLVSSNLLSNSSSIFFFNSFYLKFENSCANFGSTTDPQYYLIEDTNIRCWEPKHVTWTLALGIPSLVICNYSLKFLSKFFHRVNNSRCLVIICCHSKDLHQIWDLCSRTPTCLW